MKFLVVVTFFILILLVLMAGCSTSLPETEVTFENSSVQTIVSELTPLPTLQVLISPTSPPTLYTITEEKKPILSVMKSPPSHLDLETGMYESYGGNIYVYNLDSRITTPICTDPSDQGKPGISEKIYIWEDNRLGSWDICYMLRPDNTPYITLKESLGGIAIPSAFRDIIALNGSWIVRKDNLSKNILDELKFSDPTLFDKISYTDERDPAVSYTYMAFERKDDSNWNIYHLRYDSSVLPLFTNASEDEMAPALLGNSDVSTPANFVWMTKNSGNWDIYHWTMKGTQEKVTTNQYDQMYPSASENVLVWQDNRNGNWDIYMMNLNDRVEMALTSDPSDQMMPSICDDTVVWQDNSNGDWDVIVYNLNTKVSYRVPAESGDQECPSIYDNEVIYQDNRES